MTSLYDCSIPTIIKALKTEEAILKQGEEWAKANNVPIADIVNARLYPDMFDLSMQVMVTVLYAGKAIQALTGEEVPLLKKEVRGYNLEESYANIKEAIASLEKVKPESVNGKEQEKVEVKVGPKKAVVTAQDCTYINNTIPLPLPYFLSNPWGPVDLGVKIRCTLRHGILTFRRRAQLPVADHLLPLRHPLRYPPHEGRARWQEGILDLLSLRLGVCMNVLVRHGDVLLADFIEFVDWDMN